MIEGRLKYDTWEDKQTSQKRSKLSVVLESFQFLGDGGGNRGGAEGAPAGAPARRASTAAEPPAAADSEGPPLDDDVPF